MFQKILVPLDGSAFAEGALPLALALHRRNGDHLELLTVHEPYASIGYDEWATASQSWFEGYLEELRNRLHEKGVEVGIAVREGSVHEVLTAHAKEMEANLVVMATHGRGALTRAWLGSVADAFTRSAPCPVLLVRPEGSDKPSLDVDPDISTLLVPLDGTELSETVLPHAEAMAERFNAGIVLCRAVAYPVEIASPYLPHTVRMNQEVVDEARAAAEEYLSARAAALRAKGFRTETDVRVDPQPGHAILAAADEAGAGLIAMATHGRGGVARLVLGSTTDKVVRGAHRPVFIHRAEEA